ncbi:hypothetical protein ACTXQV_59065, partial [Klebsiella pneumoniae]
SRGALSTALLTISTVSPPMPPRRRADDYGSIFVVLPIDQRQDWYIVANTFQEFISKFYETQGDKFWEP